MATGVYERLPTEDNERGRDNEGGIYGVSRRRFFQGIEIVALTAVRATI